MIGSYPTVYAIGHKAISGIFDGVVLVEEKIDGSQFSFGVINDELMCRSKGKQIILDAPEKMFCNAISTVISIADKLHPGWIYRTEYLGKPKHNTLAYSRCPDKYLIGYDIQIGNEEYLSYNEKKDEFSGIGLETVPILWYGNVNKFDEITGFLDKESCLGGCTIEGIVVKNYSLFTQEKKIATGKYVSEKFKEVHGDEWRKSNPTSGDVVNNLILKYKTDARWMKSIQHLRENGVLENSPRDIGKLIEEIPNDILKECEEEIKNELFHHFWEQIKRGVISGFPDFYKQLIELF